MNQKPENDLARICTGLPAETARLVQSAYWLGAHDALRMQRDPTGPGTPAAGTPALLRRQAN